MKRNIVHVTSQKYNKQNNNKVYATPMILPSGMTAKLSINENNKIVAKPKIV